MNRKQAVAWLLLEGVILFRDNSDGELRWCTPGRGAPNPRMVRGKITMTHFHWRMDEYTSREFWEQVNLCDYAAHAPAVVKLLMETENEP